MNNNNDNEYIIYYNIYEYDVVFFICSFVYLAFLKTKLQNCRDTYFLTKLFVGLAFDGLILIFCSELGVSHGQRDL